ncbi:MAG: ABC transporter ATP-binding protein [Neisseriaceae bacterium]|nr:ABC transporter ATP-binding protein [Neisseriaceae bacterium]
MLNRIFSWFENRVETYPDRQPETPKHGLLHFIWSCTDGVRPWLLLLMVFTVGKGAMEAILFQFVGTLVDWLNMYSPSQLWTNKKVSLLAMAATLLLFVLWHFLAENVRLQTLQGVFPMRLRWHFHRLMLGQSLGFYQDEFAGRVSAKVMQTALAVRDSVMTFTDLATFVVVYFFSSGLILLAVDARFLLPFILWIVAFATVLFIFIPRISQSARRQANARSLMTGRVTDAYANIATVKLFSHGEREAQYAKESMQEFMVTVRAQMRLATLLNSSCFLLNTLLTLSIASLGLWLWHQNYASAGAFATALTMALRVNVLSQRIMWESVHLFENVGTVSDGMATLSKPHTIVDKQDAQTLQVSGGEIQFKNIAFAYSEDKPLLNQFNLNIQAGEKVGLIGRSGAGKSTLVNLLLRFYEPQSGEILIDGQNIQDVTQKSLRAQIGLVTQDTSLLHRSVRDNIVYGRPNASEEEMVQAAKKAQADEFIEQLSDISGRKAYDAHVGERGVKLSGGQRQRIAIARVMLKDAPILLLDEATSALDSEVEAAIQESLGSMMRGKTVIAIAHRLSTIAAMDRLIVLDKGQIVEQGTHTQLLAQNGLYAKLWAHQSGGFLPEYLED